MSHVIELEHRPNGTAWVRCRRCGPVAAGVSLLVAGRRIAAHRRDRIIVAARPAWAAGWAR